MDIMTLHCCHGYCCSIDLRRDQWVTLITKATIHYLQKKKQMEKAHRERQRRSSKGSIARLIVTVVEAADLKASDPNGKVTITYNHNLLIMTTLGLSLKLL